MTRMQTLLAMTRLLGAVDAIMQEERVVAGSRVEVVFGPQRPRVGKVVRMDSPMCLVILGGQAFCLPTAHLAVIPGHD